MSNFHTTQEMIRLYEFGDFLLDVEISLDERGSKVNRLLYNGDPDEISDRSFKLLCMFVQEPGRDFSREELVNSLWPEKHNLKLHDLDSIKRVKTHTKADEENEERKRNIRNQLQHEVGILRKQVASKTVDENGVAGLKIDTTEVGYKSTFIGETREIGQKADLNFDEWIFQDKKGKRISWSIVFGILLTGIYFVGHLVFPKHLSLQPIVVFSLMQCLLIVIALLVRKRVFDPISKAFWKEDPLWLMKKFGYEDRADWKRAKAGAECALIEYADYWKFLLASWLSIYSLLALITFVDANYKQHIKWLYVLTVFLTIANNWNSLMTYLCFFILDNPTAYGSEEKQKEHRCRLDKITKWGVGAIVSFAVVELLLLFVFLTEKHYSLAAHPVVSLADVISGIVGGITLALYVGRVQTRFLGATSWLPLMFYLYAVIQALYFYIKILGIGEPIIVAALILKGLLFLYVAWLFQSGRLLFYFVRVKAIFERVYLDWRIFLSILK